MSSTDQFGLDALYPIGTPFSLTLSLDPTAARVGSCSGNQGLYLLAPGSTLTLGSSSFMQAGGGYAAVNHHFDIGCVSPFGGQTPYAELWIFNWSGILTRTTAGNPVGLGLVSLSFLDQILIDGQLPTTPPAGAGVRFNLNVGGTLGAGLASAVALPVVPEPTSMLLLTTGLVGMAVRRLRTRHQRAPRRQLTRFS